jgi:drug/metabolite transporter (DMT)-like permease
MSSSVRSYPKTYLMIAIMVIFGPLGNVLLSKGMKSVGSIAGIHGAELLQFIGHVLGSGTIWLGIASLLTFFIANMLVLTWADYSYVLPASAVGYGTVALLGHFLLGETVSPLRWAGIIVICLGVFIAGQTPHGSTKPVEQES